MKVFCFFDSIFFLLENFFRFFLFRISLASDGRGRNFV